MKSDKMSYIIYADIESFVKKVDEYANNPKKFSIRKIGEIFLVNIQCQRFGPLIT